eukprot:TRINITY_DN1518_c0_g1_i13.p1 TRINITY_DN1518_c0_g1~~TRINITY_DN1518_c0_g1_i13.p1  ORF type:complete len:550 (-),score=82.93 TRINITY_DN1518_c0_g1_i13:116-1765(-)
MFSAPAIFSWPDDDTNTMAALMPAFPKHPQGCASLLAYVRKRVENGLRPSEKGAMHKAIEEWYTSQCIAYDKYNAFIAEGNTAAAKLLKACNGGCIMKYTTLANVIYLTRDALVVGDPLVEHFACPVATTAKKAADKDSLEAKRRIGRYCHSDLHGAVEWTVAALAAPQLVAPDLLVVALMIITGRRHKEIVCPGHQWAQVGTRRLQANLCTKGSAFNKSCKGEVKEADSIDGIGRAEFGLLDISEHVAEKFVVLRALRKALYRINADVVLKALKVVRFAVKGGTDIERQNARDRSVRALLKIEPLADLFKGYKAHFDLRNLGVHLFRSVYQKVITLGTDDQTVATAAALNHAPVDHPATNYNHLGVVFDIADHEDRLQCCTSPQSNEISNEVQQTSEPRFTGDNENVPISNSDECEYAAHPPRKDPAAAAAADCSALLEAVSDAGEDMSYTPLQDPMSAATPHKGRKRSPLKVTEHTEQCLETLAEASGGPTMIETAMTANDADIRPAARDACTPSKRQKIMSVVDGLVSAGFDVDTRLDILAKLLST